MATSGRFGYNLGGPISGTTQVGNIVVGDVDVEYAADYGGIKWWGGPDEDLGYVVGNPVSGGTQPSPVGGPAFIGFYRSKLKTDASFISLVEYISRKNGTPQTFATANDAENWLAANYYWSSFGVSPTPTPTETSIIASPTPTPTVTETSIIPTPTPTPTATDLSSITTYTISGCTNLNTLVVDLGPGFIVPGDVFYFTFSGGTPQGCYSVVGKINAPIDDGYTSSFSYGNCNDCEVANVTPTPTETSIIASPTPTPTVTETSIIPTPTPTPSSTPIPVTGYSFNLVAIPYNFPSSGNTIMNGPGGATSGSTNPNVLDTGGRGLYWNSIDSSGIDRTDYFSGFTGQSITITMSQTGSTAIYSGDTNSLKYWVSAGPGNGFVFGAGVGIPPSNIPSGTAVLIQSASTEWTIGLPVYISAVIN
jgi:hypothetical protein